MASSTNNYDKLFSIILSGEVTVISFLDKVFDFLYRHTDFFKINRFGCPSTPVPPGGAELMLRHTFKKYMKLELLRPSINKTSVKASSEENTKQSKLTECKSRNKLSNEVSEKVSTNLKEDTLSAKVKRRKENLNLQKVNDPDSDKLAHKTNNEIKNADSPSSDKSLGDLGDSQDTTQILNKSIDSKHNSAKLETDRHPDLKTDKPEKDKEGNKKTQTLDSESYNGASFDSYSWSQSIRDIDVLFKVPTHISSGKKVRVQIQQDKLCVEICRKDTWSVVKSGQLCWKIRAQDSTWVLVPGERIHICLQKSQDRWWDALFTDDPKIDLKSIDASMSYEDLDEEAHAKIQELMYKEHLKRTSKTTNNETKAHEILKKAWNCEGSPFKGQPYDPSILNFQDSFNVP